MSWEEMAAQTKTPIEFKPGRYGAHAPSILMKALWLARIGRPDLSLVISRLARRVNAWSEREDREVVRLISYIWSTLKLRLTGQVSSNVDTWRLICYSDADFLSDESGRSTSGVITMLESGEQQQYQFPLSWSSVRQTAVARSTPEAELAAASKGIYTSLFPLSVAVDSILKRKVPTALAEDNVAAELILTSGFSAQLRHLSRTHRISLSSLSESVKSHGLTIQRCPSEAMKADPLTKTFPANKWGHALHLLGLKEVVASSEGSKGNHK
jgi:hypothetical protein